MITDFYLTRNDDTVYRIIDEEIIIINLENSQFHTLNPVASRIWMMSDGNMKISEIITKIYDEFEIDENTARDDCLEFIEKASAEGIITLVEEKETYEKSRSS